MVEHRSPKPRSWVRVPQLLPDFSTLQPLGQMVAQALADPTRPLCLHAMLFLARKDAPATVAEMGRGGQHSAQVSGTDPRRAEAAGAGGGKRGPTGGYHLARPATRRSVSPTSCAASTGRWPWPPVPARRPIAPVPIANRLKPAKSGRFCWPYGIPRRFCWKA